MRGLVAALGAFMLLAAPAGAATKLRVSAPRTAVADSKIAVKIAGPRGAKVRLYVLTPARRRASDRPWRRAHLRRGRVTLTLQLSRAATYRLVACREGRKLTCA